MKDRNERLLFLLNTLIAERAEYRALEIPNDIDAQRNLLRSLLNVRPPFPVSDAFIAAQDEELKEQLIEKGIVRLDSIPIISGHPDLRLWQGDITRLEVDAVVNAANSRMLGCFVPMHGCIDNAIHSAAGVQLRLECNSIMEAQGHLEKTGIAKLTKGYNLPARYVLHTVGPVIATKNPTLEQENLLADCYRSCMQLAADYSLESIAFCCISTGEFHFPNLRAAEIAIAAVKDFLDCHSTASIHTVVFNVFKDKDYEIYRRLLD